MTTSAFTVSGTSLGGSSQINEVSGTTGQITVANGTTSPVISLDPAIITAIEAAGGGGTVIAPTYNPNGFLNPENLLAVRGAGGAAVFQITSPQYCLDRWYVRTNTTSTGQTAVVKQIQDSNGQYWQQVGRLQGSTSTQFIDAIQSFTRAQSKPYINQTVTLSFQAFAGGDYSSAAGALQVEMAWATTTSDLGLFFGQSGYTTTWTSQSVTLTGSAQTFHLTFTVPNGATQIGFGFQYTPVGTALSNDWFRFTDTRVVIGATAQDIVRQNFEQVFSDCLPFCEKSYNYSVAPGSTTFIGSVNFPNTFNTAVANGQAYGFVNLKRRKHATPSIKIYSPATGGLLMASQLSNNSDCGAGSATPFMISENNFWLMNNSGTNFNPNAGGLSTHYVSEAELV